MDHNWENSEETAWIPAVLMIDYTWFSCLAFLAFFRYSLYK
jgi:hypothetical protein